MIDVTWDDCGALYTLRQRFVVYEALKLAKNYFLHGHYGKVKPNMSLNAK